MLKEGYLILVAMLQVVDGSGSKPKDCWLTTNDGRLKVTGKPWLTVAGKPWLSAKLVDKGLILLRFGT